MIKQKKKPCKSCGVDSYIFSKGRCKSCSIKEDKKSIPKISSKGKIKREEKKEWFKELHKFYLDLWDEKENLSRDKRVYCVECGGWLKRDIYRENLACYSHILPKSNPKYKHLAMEKFNIMIVHPDCHALFETNPTKAEKQYKMKEFLLKTLEL